MTADRGGAAAIRAHSRGIAVSVKRSYRLVPDGTCALSGTQVPLVESVLTEGADFVHDLDILPFKPATDVVVFGKVHAAAGRTARELRARVRVGARQHAIQVKGPRRVVRRNGSWAFTDPEPFREIPLRWSQAYGGIDRWARPALDAAFVEPLKPWIDYDLTDVTLAAYPRNPAGCGYVVRETPEMEGMELPTIEDPDDPLTPGRLVAGHHDAWPLQPVAAGFGFVAYTWFPRWACCGLDQLPLPPGIDRGSARVVEVERGQVPRDVLTGRPLERRISDRAGNGAVPQLVFEPHLRGDEEMALENLDAREALLEFRLPGERPRIAIRPLGEGETEAPPKLMSVIVDAERRLVSLVWAAVVVPKYPHGPENVPQIAYRVAF
ncbi:MAG: DUF2169 domain-containing protein [Thermoanaerobaculia bacterium]